jgi:16S rRNA (guanine1516-N2)-methyltransferase
MTLVDATLGLAQDAMIFAALGCDVVGLERSPVVFELVADGLRRAQTDERFWEQIKGSLRIENVDATTWLASSKREFQVCYVDPMFAVKKSALSSKAMQILQALLGEDAAPSTLVELAINGARSQPKARVVVKRPRKAAPLKVGVHHAVIGSVIRYDVYQ